jgi:hypothetical protein
MRAPVRIKHTKFFGCVEKIFYRPRKKITVATKTPSTKTSGKTASKTVKKPVSPVKAAAKSTPKPATKRIAVRTSGVHGKGVFAEVNIAEGETLIEYKGEIITWPEALRRHPHDPSDPNHTSISPLTKSTLLMAK